MSAATRSGSPETSYEAAASVEDLTAKQNAVCWLLREFGAMTDQQIAQRYPTPGFLPVQSESGLRTRRSELVALGKVEFSGSWGSTSGGRRSRIWKAL